MLVFLYSLHQPLHWQPDGVPQLRVPLIPSRQCHSCLLNLVGTPMCTLVCPLTAGGASHFPEKRGPRSSKSELVLAKRTSGLILKEVPGGGTDDSRGVTPKPPAEEATRPRFLLSRAPQRVAGDQAPLPHLGSPTWERVRIQHSGPSLGLGRGQQSLFASQADWDTR